MKTEFRRNLPHIYVQDAMYSITIRLANSIPMSILSDYISEKDLLLKKGDHMAAKKLYFEKIEGYLDSTAHRNQFLADTYIIELFKSSILFFQKKHYDIVCYCIMPNHVHLIINTFQYPYKALGDILGSIKKYTGLRANRYLKRKGKFWQAESYDHLIKSRNELAETIDYILYNPVKAGLTSHWEYWPASYINPRFLDK